MELILEGPDSPNAVPIRFEDEFGATTISLCVTHVADDLVRLDSFPVMTDAAAFRDVIRIKKLEDGTLEFVCVVQSSDWRTYTFLLMRETITTPEFQRFLSKVRGLGCHWEQVMGGCLLIATPPGLDFDPEQDFPKLGFKSRMRVRFAKLYWRARARLSRLARKLNIRW